MSDVTATAVAVETAPELQQLSFDLYERYSVLRKLAEDLFPLSSGLRFLDVGANSPQLWPGFRSLLQEFLPEARCTVADVEITPGLANAVKASGLALPFPDEAFDMVCALDTLEHIPDADREAFIDELLRVSRDIVYLTFPYRSATNEWAERMVDSYLETVLESPVPQLREHAAFGLPDAEDVDRFVRARDLTAVTFKHGNTDVWLEMMLVSHTLRVRSVDILYELNKRFNREYAALDWSEPAYRTSCVISKRGRRRDLEDAKFRLKSARSGDLRADQLSTFLGFFLNLSFQAQALVDKDRHLRNVEARHAWTEKAIEDKDRHIRNLDAWREHTQKAIEDKDRHIKNLEAELTRVRAELTAAKFEVGRRDEVATLLGAVRADTASLFGTLKSDVTEANKALQTELTNVASAVQLQRAVQNEFRVEQSAIHERQQGAMQDLARRIYTQEQITTQLLNGRTWRTLQAVGKVFKIVAPRAKAATPPVPEQPPAAGAQEAVATLPPQAITEDVKFVCDEPSPEDVKPRNRKVIVRGWALCSERVERIEVAIDGLPDQQLAIGVPRPDVKLAYPESDKNGRSGFSGAVNTEGLPEGRHDIRLRLIAGGKCLREIQTRVAIDHKFGYTSDYEQWIAEFEAPAEQLIRLKLPALANGPCVSVIMPVYNTKPSELNAAIESVLGQTYGNWELCIVDDGSTRPEVRSTLDSFAGHPKIKISYSEKCGGISAGLNSGLRLATGEYIAFLDHDDTLSPHALAFVADTIDSAPGADLLYSDEDKIDENNERYEPFFKPDWSPDVLLGTNYVCHLLVVSRELARKTGEFCSQTDGSQDYDYILRAAESANKIVHIPHVLYHWRAGHGSTALSVENKPYTIEASRRSLERYCLRAANNARVEATHLPGRWRLRYPLDTSARVRIVIASGGNADILRVNLQGLFTKTNYPNFEVAVVDNSRDIQIQQLVRTFTEIGHAIEYIDWRNRPFNYSRINNEAASLSAAPMFLFLNDDVSVIDADWLGAMVELIQRREVGAVGAKLLFPDGKIQHAGVVMGVSENCGHAFRGLDGSLSHYFGFSDIIRDVSAVTGACLMTKADVFRAVGGFDEERLAVAFNDVDYCLKVQAAGYRVLFTPFATLYHHESFSKTRADLVPHPAEVSFMQSKWRRVIACDPYYSPNLTRADEDYSFAKLQAIQ